MDAYDGFSQVYTYIYIYIIYIYTYLQYLVLRDFKAKAKNFDKFMWDKNPKWVLCFHESFFWEEVQGLTGRTA